MASRAAIAAKVRLSCFSKRLALMFGLCAAVSPAHAQDTSAAQAVRITPDVAIAISRQALQQGDLELASRLTQGLLRARPDNFHALMIQALIADRRDRPDAARAVAARAFRSAETDGQKFEAAWLAANTAGKAERWEIAKLWLRRADHFAPNEITRNRVANAFRQARIRSPWRVNLTFSITPTDNLNNGSEPGNRQEDIAIGDDLSGLSASTPERIGGYRVVGSANLTYRLRSDPTSITEAFLQTFIQLGIPESGFRDVLPDASSREFDFVSALAGVTHRHSIFENVGPTDFRLGVGGSYFENRQLSNFRVFGGGQTFELGESVNVRLGFEVRDETRVDADVASSITRRTSLDWSFRTKNGDRFGFGLGYSDISSSSPGIDGFRRSVQFSVDPRQSILGMDPDFTLGISWRDLPGFRDVTNFASGDLGRTDRLRRATLGINFSDRTWYGFVPRAEFQFSQTDSSQPLFDRTSKSFAVTLASRF